MTTVEDVPQQGGPLSTWHNDLMRIVETQISWVGEVERKLEVEDKKKLETEYGVEISRDAIDFACRIIMTFPHVFLSSKSDNAMVVELRPKAVELLEKACQKLRHDLDTGADEIALDMDEYLLYRTYAELKAVNKDRGFLKRFWFTRVQNELEELINKWNVFLGKWKPLVMSLHESKRRDQGINMLEEVRQALVSCLHEAELLKKVDLDAFSRAFRQLDALVIELLGTTHKDFKQNITVGRHIIAVAASPLTGVPASWLLQSSGMMPLQDLGRRLAKRLIGQEDAIRAITSALSMPRHGSRPIGSFFFLSDRGCGKKELAKALAEELFNDKHMLTEFNMSEYMDLDSVSRLIGSPSSHEKCGMEGKLTEAVKSRPFSIILFCNVDMTHGSVVEILAQVLNRGKLEDGQRKVVDFTGTLIIMTSSALDSHLFRPVSSCHCAKFPQFPIKGELQRERKHSVDEYSFCYLSILTKAKKLLNSGLLENVDDVIILKSLGSQQCQAVARLQVRDIASSMGKNGFSLYPYEVACYEILWRSNWMQEGGQGMRVWLEQNLVPALLDMPARNEKNDLSTLYIDILLGTREVSYRLEKSGDEADDQEIKQLKASLKELRIFYRKEKERVGNIYMLRSNYSKLNALLPEIGANFGSFAVVVWKVVDVIDDLIKNAADVKFMPDGSSLLQSFCLNKAELREAEQPNKQVKKGVEDLRTGQYQAIDLVAESFLSYMNAAQDLSNRPIKSFLFLGLTAAGMGELIRSLTENFVNNGSYVVIQINLSECASPETFFMKFAGLPEYSGHERQSAFGIIILDQVENASISVFGALLSVLDQGILSDDQGHTICFKNKVIIITSNLGNKELLARLVSQVSRDIASSHGIEQGGKGLRSELFNRVDEIVFFNPFANNQLRKISRLPMRGGSCLESGSINSLFSAFDILLQKDQKNSMPGAANNPSVHRSEDMAVRILASELIKDGITPDVKAVTRVL